MALSSPNFLKFLEILIEPFEDLQLCIEGLRDGTSIVDAAGVWLDVIGDLVGLPRPHREQPYGTIFAFKALETDVDDPYKGFYDSGGPTGGYFQTTIGTPYIADPTENIDDEDYRRQLKAKGLANQTSGTVQDIYNYLVSGYQQEDPTITTEVGAVLVTVENDQILTQGERYVISERGPVAAGIGINIENWPSEHMPFHLGMNDPTKWTIDEDTVDSEFSKILTMSGTDDWAWVDIQDWAGATAAEAAYGTWTFWINKAASSATRFLVIADEPERFSDANQDGYLINIPATEEISISRVTSGATATLMQTAAATATAATWEKYTITRTAAGIFSVYLNDVLVTAVIGTNPVTDNTHTTSQYVVIDPDQGDDFGLSVFDTDVILTNWEPL